MSRPVWGWVLAVALALPAGVVAQETLTIEQAAEHIGEEATVCGEVAHAVFIERERRQPTFLNFGEPWPDQIFNVLIPGRHRPRFEQPPEETFAGREVCVTGLIEESDFGPQITVTRPEQIALVEPPEEGLQAGGNVRISTPNALRRGRRA